MPEQLKNLFLFLLLSVLLHSLGLLIEVPGRDAFSRDKKTVGLGIVYRSADQFSPVAVQPGVAEESEPFRRMAPSITTPPAGAEQPLSVVITVDDKRGKIKISPAAKVDLTASQVVKVAEDLPIEKQIYEDLRPARLSEEKTGNDQPAQSERQETLSVGSAISQPALSDSGSETHSLAEDVSVASLGFTDALPRYDVNPAPKYPEVARRRGQQGTVVLQVTVLQNGDVGGLSISSSSGHKNLDRSALDAVRRWIFSPATSSGFPVVSQVLVPVRFDLD